MVALTTESIENILVMITPWKISQLLPGGLLGIVGHKKAWKLDTHNSLTLPMTSDWRFFWSFFFCFSPFSARVKQRTPKPACLSCLSISQRLLCDPWDSSSCFPLRDTLSTSQFNLCFLFLNLPQELQHFSSPLC